MRKTLVLMLGMVMLLSTALTAFAGDPMRVAMVTDVGGVNDRSFNQNVWEGLQMAERDLGMTVSYLQSNQEADYVPNLESLLDAECGLIFGVGFMLQEAVMEAAKDNPETNYVCVDAEYDSPPANLVGIKFREEQPGFLAGYVAGKMSQTGKIGFLGGMEVPAVVAFEWGYVAGAKYANDEIEVLQQYANSFNDVAKGKAIAKQMYQDGADIVFCCGGTMGTGGIEAAKEDNKWCIGVDVDQSYLAPDHMLTSAMKFLDIATLELCRLQMEGTFTGGMYIGDLSNNMVGLPDTTKNLVPQVILDEVNALTAQILSGDIEIPINKDQAVEMGYIAG